MDVDKLKADFKQQIITAIAQADPDPAAAMASGMLILITALIKNDSSTLVVQLHIMHQALREIGEERGWGVTKQP